MRWFGAPRGVPMEADCEHVETPLRVLCGCGRHRIADGDQGVLIVHAARSGLPLPGRGWFYWERPWRIDCFARLLGIEPHGMTAADLVAIEASRTTLAVPDRGPSSLTADDPALD